MLQRNAIRIALILFISLFMRTAEAQINTASGIAKGFRNVPASARMRMYWRVFGPAWAPSEIDYQLSLLKKAGVGGVMTYFTYPVALDDAASGIHNTKFLGKFLRTPFL